MDFKARILSLPKGFEEGVYKEIDVKLDVDWYSSSDVLIGPSFLSCPEHLYTVVGVKEIPLRAIESDNDCIGFWYRFKFINPQQVYVTKNFFDGSIWTKIGEVDDFLRAGL